MCVFAQLWWVRWRAIKMEEYELAIARAHERIRTLEAAVAPPSAETATRPSQAAHATAASDGKTPSFPQHAAGWNVTRISQGPPARQQLVL